MKKRNKKTDKSQDKITEEEPLSSPDGEETESPPDFSPEPEAESTSMDSSADADLSEEEPSAPSIPIDGDMKSLPLGEEIQKQKESMMRTKKLTLVGVVGVIVLLILIKVFTGKDQTPGKTQTSSFTTTPEFTDSKQYQGEPQKQKIQSPSLKTADAAKKYKTKKPKPSSRDAAQKKDYFLYGISRYEEGNNIEAIKAFKMGMKNNPDLKEIGYNNQGVIFMEKKNPNKGIQYFKQALKVNPRYADAHYNLATVYERGGNDQRALFHYQRFLELAKNDYPELTGRVKQHLGNR